MTPKQAAAALVPVLILIGFLVNGVWHRLQDDLPITWPVVVLMVAVPLALLLIKSVNNVLPRH